MIAVSDVLPTRGLPRSQRLRIGALCRIVPGSWTGAHCRAGRAHGWRPDAERCGEVTEDVLRTVFSHLSTQRVMLEGLILKPNMVLPGLTCPTQEAVDEVADATVRCLLRAVPAAVPGVAFLSGGQPSELASARLNAMHVRFTSRLPWALTFSFARASSNRRWRSGMATKPTCRGAACAESPREVQRGRASRRVRHRI